MDKVVNFFESKKDGQKGEKLFLELNLDKLDAADGYKFDFTLKDSDRKVELKSDYYDSDKTENFFMERYSNFQDKSNGGVWQSAENGVHYYVYFFVKNKHAYVFKVKDLVKKLNEICDEKDLIFIPNKTWVTAGYKVNRKLLEDVLLQEKVYV